MPKIFFEKSPLLTVLRTDTEPTKTEANVSQIVRAPNERPTPGLSFSPPVHIQPETQAALTDLNAVPSGDAAAQSQTNPILQEASLPPDIIAPTTGWTSALSIESSESEVLDAGSPVEPFAAPAPMPETSLPEYLQSMQPQINPAVASPSPAGLRINRMDIQIMNPATPPAPRAAAADMWRLLEKKHLGRAGLLL